MDVLYATYPLSVGFIGFMITITIIIITLIFGFFGAIILIACMYLGIVHVTPMFKAIAYIIDLLNPGLREKVRDNIYKSFTLEYSSALPKTPHIFAFHPHGIFSVANLLHIGTDLTEWSHKPIKGTISDKVTYFPAAEEIVDVMNFVTSDYNNMKEVIDNGSSLTVCMGGVREVLYIQPNKLTVTILKKQGIFRLAIETGTPLVPVITYGENEILDLIDTPFISWIQKKIIPYGMALLIPTPESSKRWYNIVNEPLKEKIRTVIGTPIDVGEPRKATHEEIVKLRERYFVELRKLYRETKPASYAEEIDIV